MTDRLSEQLQSAAQIRYRPAEDAWIVERTSEHDGALDAGHHLFGERRRARCHAQGVQTSLINR